jgi:DASH family cryptochrome
LDLPKWNLSRFRFLLESIQNLSEELLARNQNLYLLPEGDAYGFPIGQEGWLGLFRLLSDQWEWDILLGEAFSYDEEKILENAKIWLEEWKGKSPRKIFSQIRVLETETILNRESLPFPIKDLPYIFTDFRKIIESQNVLDRISKPEIPVLLKSPVMFSGNSIFSEPEKIFQIPKAVKSDSGQIPKEPIKLYFLDSLQDWNHFQNQVLAEIPDSPDTIQKLYGGLDPSPEILNKLKTRSEKFQREPLFHGGEKNGRNRIHEYIWEKDLLKVYKETRNQLLGLDFSSKFSPWLAVGAISARSIITEIRQYEKRKIANDSTYWLVFELLWREFFKLTAKKQKNKLFQKHGFAKKSKENRAKFGTGSEFLNDNRKPNPGKDLIQSPLNLSLEKFYRWITGQTGQRFIDANMRELFCSSYMSNRGRQNVASYLVHSLNLDWRWGAEWFEYQLIDYDPAANWGNWAYQAGVGNDPRARVFNPEKQSMDYDPTGAFQSFWLDQF